jgi:hypothetical protein
LILPHGDYARTGLNDIPDAREEHRGRWDDGIVAEDPVEPHETQARIGRLTRKRLVNPLHPKPKRIYDSTSPTERNSNKAESRSVLVLQVYVNTHRVARFCECGVRPVAQNAVKVELHICLAVRV